MQQHIGWGGRCKKVFLVCVSNNSSPSILDHGQGSQKNYPIPIRAVLKTEEI